MNHQELPDHVIKNLMTLFADLYYMESRYYLCYYGDFDNK
jgi:hypothetical protein